jgi:hypothetical protein
VNENPVKIYLCLIFGEQRLVGSFDADKVPELVAFFLSNLPATPVGGHIGDAPNAGAQL